MSGQPAAVRVLQRIELCDTDVTGHYHHSTVIRWVEAAEQTLLHRLGLEYLPIMPRVNYTASYRHRLWRHEVVEVGLRVAEVGRTSLRYLFEVAGGEGPSVDGSLTVVKVEADSGPARPWTGQERKVLLESGPQEGDLLRSPRRAVARVTERHETARREPGHRGSRRCDPAATRPSADAWGIGFG
ncbi:acyl-CoA thioesterase [Actinomadura hibisca]|uniref:acyl-CoA thioesterase n=1 Tax=Actinomadura hibisca TaxID=68565 RepID=UPI000B1C5D2B|nr:hotdog domain-containing protein [Actinomadura hibisca]